MVKNPNSAPIVSQLMRCPTEDDHLVHIRAFGIDGGMGLPNPVPSNAIFMFVAFSRGGQLAPRPAMPSQPLTTSLGAG